MRPRVTPYLDFDVFRTVLNHLTVADLKEVSVVSHTFHEEALREILLRGVRFTGPPAKLVAFCNFMLSRDPPLFPFLHTFTFHINLMSVVEPFNPTPLLDVLSSASFLRDLEIHWSLFTPDCDERLTAIIPELSHLRRLRLFTPVNTRKLVTPVVYKLRTQLHTFEVCCPNEASYVNEDLPPDLGAYQTHLRVLHIAYPDLINISWVPFPTVHTLQLLWPTDLPISLRHIAQTFPSLRQLAISVGVHVWGGDPRLARARDDALTFQRFGGGWRSLDALVASTIPEAWMLGLVCPVAYVRLGVYDSMFHEGFVDVIHGARPKTVSFALRCIGGCEHPEGEQPIFIFPTDAGPGPGAVTHAVMFLLMQPVHEWGASSVDQGTSEIIRMIESHIRHSRLEYLHVVIGAEYVFSRERFADPEWEIYERVLKPSIVVLHVFRQAFQDIDVEALVSALAAAGEHLRVIVLTITIRGQSVWTVDRGKTGKTASKVTDPVDARKIIEREERAYSYQM